MKPVRHALWVWYRGGAFTGFQAQPDGRSVQQALEASMAGAPILTRAMGAARTDLGVSARMQVVLVKTAEPCDTASLKERMNEALAPHAGVAMIRPAHQTFQPQWHCSGKEYRYRLAGEVDARALDQVLGRYVGTRTFHSFHARGSPVRPRTVRTAEHLPASRIIRIVGDAFGRFQVRIMVGAALAVAAGTLPREVFEAALRGELRMDALRAPPSGLVLWEVHYPAALDPFSAEDRAATLRDF